MLAIWFSSSPAAMLEKEAASMFSSVLHFKVRHSSVSGETVRKLFLQQYLRLKEKISVVVTFDPHYDLLNLSLSSCFNLTSAITVWGFVKRSDSFIFSNLAQSSSSQPRWITRCLCLFISRLCGYCHTDAGLFGSFTLAIKMLSFFPLSILKFLIF